MSVSRRILEKLNRLSTDKEQEQIRKFEAEIHREYGPTAAIGMDEIKALFRQWKLERSDAGK